MDFFLFLDLIQEHVIDRSTITCVVPTTFQRRIISLSKSFRGGKRRLWSTLKLLWCLIHQNERDHGTSWWKKKTHQTTRTSLLVGITSRQYIMYVEREKWSASRKLDEREQFQQPVRSSFHINTEMGFFFYWPDVDNLLIQSVRELGDCCLTITGHHSTKCFRYPPSEV